MANNCDEQILYKNSPLTGVTPCGKVFGINGTNGNLFYKNTSGTWSPVSVGSSTTGLTDVTIMFSVNADPNTIGTTFSPNTPALGTVLYVSTIDYRVWVYVSGTYQTYSPSLGGNVSSGLANQLAYYAANGTTVGPLTAITANRALISSASGLPIASSVTNTELGYVSGVTSAIQTQLNSKQATITTGSTSQYFRGDLSLATFPTTLALSSITAPITSNVISNALAIGTQQWSWTGTTDDIFRILSTSTARFNNTSVLTLGSSGAITGSKTLTTLKTSATNTGASVTNVAATFTAGNGLNNYALLTLGGLVGFGTATPTAQVHIAAGTATAGTAPIKLSAGTVLTTPENGAIEYSGTHLYITIAGVRYQLDQQIGTIINYADEEIPSGTQDSSNPTFTLAHTPITGSLKLYLRGMRLKNTADYTISGSTLTMINIPDALDAFLADYRY